MKDRQKYVLLAGATVSTIAFLGLIWYFRRKSSAKDENDDDNDSDELEFADVTASSVASASIYSLEVTVPKYAVGAIIGKGGQNIRQLIKETGVRLEFNRKSEDEKDDGDRILFLKGDRERVLKAEIRVKEVIEAVPAIIKMELMVPQGACGRIIGKGGQNIRDMCRVSGAKVEVDRDNITSNELRKVIITGTKVQAEYAELMVNEHVAVYKQFKERTPPPKEVGPRERRKSLTPVMSEFPVVKLPDTTEFFQVFVSAFEKPDHFWVQPINEDSSKLDALGVEMTTYFNGLLDEEGQLRQGKIGDICCAPFNLDNDWYRACIIGFDRDSNAELYYIDYGDTGVIPIIKIKEIRPEYLDIPAQAVECYLGGVIPSGEDWSESAIDDFETLSYCAQWVPLMAKITNSLEVKKKQIPCLQLVDTNDEKELDIASELVQRGHAYFQQGMTSERVVASERDLASITSLVGSPDRNWNKANDMIKEEVDEDKNLEGSADSAEGMDVTGETIVPESIGDNFTSPSDSWDLNGLLPQDGVDISCEGRTMANVGMETAGMEAATMETAGMKTASMEFASMETAGMKTASMESASMETATKETATIETAAMETTPKGLATMETATMETPTKDTTTKENATMETASIEIATMEAATIESADTFETVKPKSLSGAPDVHVPVGGIQAERMMDDEDDLEETKKAECYSHLSQGALPDTWTTCDKDLAMTIGKEEVSVKEGFSETALNVEDDMYQQIDIQSSQEVPGVEMPSCEDMEASPGGDTGDAKGVDTECNGESLLEKVISDDTRVRDGLSAKSWQDDVGKKGHPVDSLAMSLEEGVSEEQGEEGSRLLCTLSGEQGSVKASPWPSSSDPELLYGASKQLESDLKKEDSLDSSDSEERFIAESPSPPNEKHFNETSMGYISRETLLSEEESESDVGEETSVALNMAWSAKVPCDFKPDEASRKLEASLQEYRRDELCAELSTPTAHSFALEESEKLGFTDHLDEEKEMEVEGDKVRYLDSYDKEEIEMAADKVGFSDSNGKEKEKEVDMSADKEGYSDSNENEKEKEMEVAADKEEYLGSHDEDKEVTDNRLELSDKEMASAGKEGLVQMTTSGLQPQDVEDGVIGPVNDNGDSLDNDINRSRGHSALFTSMELARQNLVQMSTDEESDDDETDSYFSARSGQTTPTNFTDTDTDTMSYYSAREDALTPTNKSIFFRLSSAESEDDYDIISTPVASDDEANQTLVEQSQLMSLPVTPLPVSLKRDLSKSAPQLKHSVAASEPGPSSPSKRGTPESNYVIRVVEERKSKGKNLSKSSELLVGHETAV